MKKCFRTIIIILVLTILLQSVAVVGLSAAAKEVSIKSTKTGEAEVLDNGKPMSTGTSITDVKQVLLRSTGDKTKIVLVTTLVNGDLGTFSKSNGKVIFTPGKNWGDFQEKADQRKKDQVQGILDILTKNSAAYDKLLTVVDGDSGTSITPVQLAAIPVPKATTSSSPAPTPKATAPPPPPPKPDTIKIGDKTYTIKDGKLLDGNQEVPKVHYDPKTKKIVPNVGFRLKDETKLTIETIAAPSALKDATWRGSFWELDNKAYEANGDKRKDIVWEKNKFVPAKGLEFDPRKPGTLDTRTFIPPATVKNLGKLFALPKEFDESKKKDLLNGDHVIEEDIAYLYDKSTKEVISYDPKEPQAGFWVHNTDGTKSFNEKKLYKGLYAVQGKPITWSSIINGPFSTLPLANKWDDYRDWVRQVDQEFSQTFLSQDFYESWLCENVWNVETKENTGIMKTGSDTYQFVGHIEAEYFPKEELLCSADNECPKDLECKEDGFCYKGDKPAQGYLHKITWGVVAPSDEKFLQEKGLKGEEVTFNIEVTTNGKSSYIFSDEDGYSNEHTIKLSAGENSASRFPPIILDYSEKIIDTVCIKFGVRPLSVKQGFNLKFPNLNPWADKKDLDSLEPVPDICYTGLSQTTRTKTISTINSVSRPQPTSYCGLNGC